jgi:hypothetical protein
MLVATSAFAQFAERTIKFTNGVNEDHPVGGRQEDARSAWPPRPAARSRSVPSGAARPAATCLRPRRCARARKRWCAPASSPLVGIVKELGAFDLPFLFANEKEADAVLDGPAGQYFNKKLEEAGWSTWPTGKTVFAT